MNADQFVPEITRLFEGFRMGDELTKTRMEAYWARYGSLPAEVWRAVVTRALLNPNGLPYDTQLDRLVGEIEAEHQQRKAREVRGRGQGGSYLGVIEGAAGPATMRSHHARFWMTIIRGELEDHLSPSDVADLLSEQSWPSELSADIERLKASPDWVSFHAANRASRSYDREQYQPRQKPVQQETLRWDQQ